MGCDKNWALDIDISILAHIFGINIAVYKNDKKRILLNLYILLYQKKIKMKYLY